jgi:hypothetical protein
MVEVSSARPSSSDGPCGGKLAIIALSANTESRTDVLRPVA